MSPTDGMMADDLGSTCTCIPGEGCDAEGQPGCGYCAEADPELPCPADDDGCAMFDPWPCELCDSGKVPCARGYAS